MSRIINLERSIVVGADVGLEDLTDLLEAVREVDGIGGIKVGFRLGLRGLDRVSHQIRSVNSSWVVIYDHQKAGTDTPHTGTEFALAMKEGKVDAAILYPQAGPETEITWIRALQNVGVEVMVGGEMTHCGFLMSDGGFIADNAPTTMVTLAALNNVRHFILPGNKPDMVRRYKGLLERTIGDEVFDLHTCGYENQGGQIPETGKEAGQYWHAIVGRGIYQAGNVDQMRAAAERYASEIRSLG